MGGATTALLRNLSEMKSAARKKIETRSAGFRSRFIERSQYEPAQLRGHAVLRKPFCYWKELVLAGHSVRGSAVCAEPVSSVTVRLNETEKPFTKRLPMCGSKYRSTRARLRFLDSK